MLISYCPFLRAVSILAAAALSIALALPSVALAQAGFDPNIQHEGFSAGQVQDWFSDAFGDPLTSVFLHELFGPLFPSVDRADSATHATVFSTVIGYINVVALGLGGVLFAWNATAGLLQTAHEGELLGRRWSSLWAPLRVVFAVGLLVPLPGLHGYNAAQAGVAYLVKGSTSAASFVWSKSAQFLLRDSIPIAASPPKVPAGLMNSMYSIAACRVILEYQLEAAEGPTSFWTELAHQVDTDPAGRSRERVYLLLHRAGSAPTRVCGLLADTPILAEYCRIPREERNRRRRHACRPGRVPRRPLQDHALLAFPPGVDRQAEGCRHPLRTRLRPEAPGPCPTDRRCHDRRQYAAVGSREGRVRVGRRIQEPRRRAERRAPAESDNWRRIVRPHRYDGRRPRKQVLW